MATIEAEAQEGMAKPIADALIAGALPGESDGLDTAALAEAGAFVAGVAARRTAGEPAIALESIGGDDPLRRMRLAIVNDDMPFLVDSVAARPTRRL